MKSGKIRILNPSHSLEVQQWLFSQGCSWLHSKNNIQKYNDFGILINGKGEMVRVCYEDEFLSLKYKEISMEQYYEFMAIDLEQEYPQYEVY